MADYEFRKAFVIWFLGCAAVTPRHEGCSPTAASIDFILRLHLVPLKCGDFPAHLNTFFVIPASCIYWLVLYDVRRWFKKTTLLLNIITFPSKVLKMPSQLISADNANANASIIFLTKLANNKPQRVYTTQVRTTAYSFFCTLLCTLKQVLPLLWTGKVLKWCFSSFLTEAKSQNIESSLRGLASMQMKINIWGCAHCLSLLFQYKICHTCYWIHIKFLLLMCYFECIWTRKKLNMYFV